MGRIPVYINASLFEPNTERRPSKDGKYGILIPGGDLIGQWTIPVADRIPDELLDELRRDPKGSLRIKIRLHREGVLLGWDIERRPNPWGFTLKEINERNIAILPAWSHTGGDFKEARPAFYVWEGADFRGLPTRIPSWPQGNRNFASLPAPWRWQGFISLPHAEQLGGVVPAEWAAQGLFITSPKDPCCDTRVKGALYEKGWYLHPKTGQRIETYF